MKNDEPELAFGYFRRGFWVGGRLDIEVFSWVAMEKAYREIRPCVSVFKTTTTGR